jgi:hypothetical protein
MRIFSVFLHCRFCTFPFSFLPSFFLSYHPVYFLSSSSSCSSSCSSCSSSCSCFVHLSILFLLVADGFPFDRISYDGSSCALTPGIGVNCTCNRCNNTVFSECASLATAQCFGLGRTGSALVAVFCLGCVAAGIAVVLWRHHRRRTAAYGRM